MYAFVPPVSVQALARSALNCSCYVPTRKEKFFFLSGSRFLGFINVNLHRYRGRNPFETPTKQKLQIITIKHSQEVKWKTSLTLLPDKLYFLIHWEKPTPFDFDSNDVTLNIRIFKNRIWNLFFNTIGFGVHHKKIDEWWSTNVLSIKYFSKLIIIT